MRVLISRTDALGDLILSLPLASILSQMKGEKIEVDYLCRRDLIPVIECCEHIQRGVPYPVDEPREFRRILTGYDILIHVLPRPRVAWEGMRARIPMRIGTAFRWYHWVTCTHMIPLWRYRRRTHEAELNLKLLTPLGIVPPPSEQIPFHYGITRIPSLRDELASRLDSGRFRLVLHPFSQGHGREWPPIHFFRLIQLLPAQKIQVILTGSSEERKRWESFSFTLRRDLLNLMGETSLTDLIALLAEVDGLVASSTGPLHLAAALGKYALGLFPPLPSLGPERWRPMGHRAEYMVSSTSCTGCPNPGKCACMATILPEMVCERILSWLSSK